MIRVMHGSLEVLGFRIGKFCYVTDAKSVPDDQMPLLAGLDTLILNALHRREHFSHLNLEEAMEMADRIAAGQTFFTHLSHDMGRHAEVESELPGSMRLAYDGLSISVPA